jgi:hypothetical protein
VTEAAAIVEGLRRATAKAKRDQHEDELAFQIRAHRLPEPHRQHAFALELGRRWRFDFAWTQFKLAAEFEGLVATRAMLPKGQGQRGWREAIVLTGRHTSPEGFKEDVEKYNTATLLGWRLLRFHRDQVKSGEAIAMLERVFHALGWERQKGKSLGE